MTIELDDGLARAAEACTAYRGETLGDLKGRVRADYVRGAHKASSMDLLTRGGHRVPCVDVDNWGPLYDLMDARD
ncbi:MAG: hypothetical protein OXI74_01180 [Rhodospirillaceae bacterium]|nr:hypothetical protein [Rhodospirillaceae bacterium]